MEKRLLPGSGLGCVLATLVTFSAFANEQAVGTVDWGEGAVAFMEANCRIDGNNFRLQARAEQMHLTLFLFAEGTLETVDFNRMTRADLVFTRDHPDYPRVRLAMGPSLGDMGDYEINENGGQGQINLRPGSAEALDHMPDGASVDYQFSCS